MIAQMTPRSHVREEAQQHSEGTLAGMIENQTARLPSDTFLWAAVGALGLSCCSNLCGRKHDALFIGQYAAPILLLGVYNKLVKVAGSDRTCS
jgi:hypothetical protein